VLAHETRLGMAGQPGSFGPFGPDEPVRVNLGLSRAVQ
jgi:hypothetical protein